MNRSNRLIIVLVWLAAAIFLMAPWLTAPRSDARAQSSAGSPKKIVAPKIWDAKALSTWFIPIAGVNATPHFYSEEEYYAAPVDNLKTYPVYFPGREPKDYTNWLKQQKPQPLVEPEKLKTEKDWLEAGRLVFEGLDDPPTRTNDPRALNYFSNPAAIKRDGMTVTEEGEIIGVRWVVDRDGELKISFAQCSACHTRVMEDGSTLRGAQGNAHFENSFGVGMILANAGKIQAQQGLTPQQRRYARYGTPWIKDDINARFQTMTNEAVRDVSRAIPGTFPRFNGSPYYTTRIPDLIGIKDRKYLDATGTHLNRGPADIARYAALITTADDGEIGPYKFYTEEQRRLTFRFLDEALYALGLYIYSLKPPPNPNKFDALARQGQRIFEREGCATCHTPPLYTNNKLIAVEGFDTPKDDPGAARQNILDVMEGMRIGTDSGLALKTRKGTGYYKVPSLKGLWYRTLTEHSGSIASLEDWFNPARLESNYVPTGWRGPGVLTRALPGHPFGLKLSAQEKRALVAFLKTL